MRYTYILLCADSTLYTGITTNLERRVAEHNTDNTRWARYTRSRRPVRLVRSQHFENRSQASKEEYRIKHLSTKQKQALVENIDNISDFL